VDWRRNRYLQRVRSDRYYFPSRTTIIILQLYSRDRNNIILRIRCTQSPAIDDSARTKENIILYAVDVCVLRAIILHRYYNIHSKYVYLRHRINTDRHGRPNRVDSETE